MPEYAYRCTECDHEFDVRKPTAEAAREELCPVCGSDCRKIWATTAVRTSCHSGNGAFS